MKDEQMVKVTFSVAHTKLVWKKVVLPPEVSEEVLANVGRVLSVAIEEFHLIRVLGWLPLDAGDVGRCCERFDRMVRHGVRVDLVNGVYLRGLG